MLEDFEDDNFDIPEWYEDEDILKANQDYKNYIIKNRFQVGFDFHEEVDYCARGEQAALFNHDFDEASDYRNRISFLKWQILFSTVINN